MRHANCPREVEVLKAIRAGSWEEGLSAHAATCVACGEIAQASQWMQALAQGTEKPTLPDASVLWWSAQLSERRANAEKARDILDWAEIISVTVIAGGLATWIGWNWYAMQFMSISLLADTWPQLWITAGSVTDLTSIVFWLAATAIPFLVAIALVYPLAVGE